MAVSVVRSGSSFEDFNNQATCASVQAAVDDYIYVGVITRRTDGNTVSSVTWNSESFTKVTEITGTDPGLDIWRLKCASGATATLTVNFTGYLHASIGYAVLQGVDGSSPNGTVSTQVSNSSTALPSLTVSGSAGDLVLQILGDIGWNTDYNDASAAAWSPANGQTVLFTREPSPDSVGEPMLKMATKAGGASVTVGYTVSGSTAVLYAHAAVNINASGGGSAPSITDAGDETYTNGETGIVITGTSFGASQGSGTVKISPTDDVDDANAVAQTVTAWGDTSVTFTAVRSTLAVNTTCYLFVTKDGGYSNASGFPVSFYTVGDTYRSFGPQGAQRVLLTL